MPTYDYRCPSGHEFEHFFRKISEATAELACPQCGALAERRVSGGAGLVFKGSGFYLTDYGRNAHRKAAPEKAKSDSKGDVKADTKSESSKAEPSAPASSSDAGSSAKSESGSATPASNTRKASGE